MIFKLKQNLSALAIFIGVAALIGCGSTSSKTTESANAKPAATIETRTTETAGKGNVVVETTTGKKTTIEGKDGEPSTTIYDNSTKSTASSADKVGVAECDEYIEKYDACVTGKVPEAARAAMRSSIEQMRQLWKSAAANPQAKAALAGGCKQALETTKQSMSSYACAW